MPASPIASLASIGLDDARRAEVAALGDDLIPGRVVRVDRGMATATTDVGDVRLVLPVDTDLAVGDFVALTPSGALCGLLERHGAVNRLVGHRRDTLQVLAANVDYVLVVRPLDLTSSPHRIQSLLTLGYDSGATPVVVLTKADLIDDPSEQVDAIASIAPGVEIIVASVVTGQGVDRVREVISGHTVVFIGESGGGKSTLTNLLVGDELLAIGDTTRNGQGRHTTSHRELVALPGGGAIIDTPGVREVIAALTSDQIHEGFADIAELAAGCRFSDCKHGSEPGCAVRAALEGGSLSRGRLDAYEAALRDSAFNERRLDKAAQAAQRKEWRALERSRRSEQW